MRPLHLIALVLMLGLEASRSPAESGTGPIASFRVANDDRNAVESRVISFGQVLRPGALQPGQAVKVSFSGAPADAQMDAKALYPDGSIRHGVVSVRLPKMTAGENIAGLLAPGQGPPPASVLLHPSSSPPAITVTLAFRSAPAPANVMRVDLPALVRAARGGRPRPWLSGPLADERRYASDVVQGVQVVFDVWTPAAGPSRVDVIVHNDSAQNAQIGTRIYDAAITLDGAAVFHTAALTHYAYATWRHTIWTDGRPPPRMIPDLGLLEETGAIPRYVRFRPDPAKAADFSRLSTASGGPLGVAGLTPYMPTTGGRADIGPLPAWAVFYLLEPSRENLQTLLANADAAGSIPWHVRDMRTDGPIDIDRHPEVWLDGRGQAAPGIMERKYYTLDTKWQPDDAHQPSLTYLPYLLTGSQYYRDELAMQAGYVLLAIDPAYRGRDAGIVLGSQVRAVAWDLRTLANAAYILPSDSRLPGYFTAKLLANLREIDRRYVHGHELDGAGELQGYLPGPYAVDGATPPWQDDYLAIVLGWIDGMGYHQARPILEWMTNFVAGRFTNTSRGYDPIYGTPYYLMVADPHSRALLNSWSAAFKWTFDPAKPVTGLDSPDSAGGYAALARASLASIINATGSAQARQAYAFVERSTPRLKDSYPREPNFAIGLAAEEARADNGKGLRR
jgi:hypothetical protein